MRKFLTVLIPLMLIAAPVVYADGQSVSVYNDFPGGVVINGMPVLNTYGNKVFWVDSNIGSDGNKGTWRRPFATIDYAVGRCTANRGDIIFVKPNHVETVDSAGDLDLDVAGISVIGLGTGTHRPEIRFTGGTSDIDVDAANITFSGFELTQLTTASSTLVDVNSADFKMINNLITESSALASTDTIMSDANADRMVIDGLTYKGGNATSYWASAQSCINIVGGDDITIRNVNIDGEFAQAAIENVTTAAENLKFGGDNQTSYIRNNNYNVIFTAVATTRGFVGPNINSRLHDDAANITEAFVGADMQFMNPIRIVNADGESDIEWNGTASTD